MLKIASDRTRGHMNRYYSTRDAGIAPPDLTAPTFAGASVNGDGNTVIALLSEDPSLPILPSSGITGFSISGASGRSLSGGTRSGDSTVLLPITGGVIYDTDTITLSYNSGTGNVTDNVGNAMASFTNQAVTNGSTQTYVDPITAIANLELYYKSGLPGSGTTWTDQSGNGRDGTLTNGPTWSSGNVVFDGSNDYVETGYTLPTQGTLIIKAKNNGSVNDARIVGAGDSSGGSHGVELIVANSLYLVARNSGSSGDCISIGGALSSSIYEEMAITWGAAGVKFYRNGTLMETNTNITSISTGGLTLKIGRPGSGSSQYFTGSVNRMMVWSRQLTGTEVSTVYAN